MYNERISQIDRLRAVYGSKTSFHDGEIISLLLERDRCSLTLRVLMPKVAGAENVEGAHNYLVGLYFENTDGLSIEGFNHQNAIQQLAVDGEGTRLKVSCLGLFGTELSFTCEKAALIDITETPMNTGGTGAESI
jgi:hypothetical protein